jgi:hypothetical protein
MSDSDIFVNCNNIVSETLIDPDDFFISYESTLLTDDDNNYSSSYSDLSDTVTFTCDDNTVNKQPNSLNFIDSDEDKQDIISSDISDTSI